MEKFEHIPIKTEFEVLKSSYINSREPRTQLQLLVSMEKAAETTEDLETMLRLIHDEIPLKRRIQSRLDNIKNNSRAA